MSRKYTLELLKECVIRDNADIKIEYNNSDITRDSKIEFICSCGKEGIKILRYIYENGGAFCKDCTKLNQSIKQKNTITDIFKDTNRKEEIISKRKDTTLKKYGVEYALQSSEIQNKIKNTNLKKYGVERATQTKEIKDKKKNTMIKKYGVEHALQSKEIQDKMKNNNLNKYGVDCVLQLKEIQDKVKDTMIKKYGVEYPLQSKDINDKKKNTNIKRYGVEHPIQIKEIKDKLKVTNLKKYGVEYYTLTDDMKEKSKETSIKKYGVGYPSQSVEIKDKIKNTNLKKYGVESVLQSVEIKDKIKNTNLKKYGVAHPHQFPEIAEKACKNSYKIKEFITPSGNKVYLQGYEPYAYKILLETYNEDEIINSRKEVPEIWWVDIKGNKHRYYVDFYIPKDNLMIEVKSKRTYSMDDKKHKIEKTLQSCKDSGYNIELWILNEKGEILQKLIK